MNNPNNRSRYGLIAAVIATATGLAVATRFLWRQRKKQTIVPIRDDKTEPPQPTVPLEVRETAQEVRPSLFVLLLSLIGLGCFTLAQTMLLMSRNPVQPMLLYIVGFAALLPLLNRPLPMETESKYTVTSPQGFVLASVGMFMLVTGYIHVQLPSPTTPLIEQTVPMLPFLPLLDLSVLQNISTVMVVLFVPAVFWFGYFLSDSLTGLLASGMAAVSLWTLALGKGGQIYAILALCGALYLAALFYARRKLMGYFLAAMLFIVGMLVSRYFIVLIFLPILQWDFAILDEYRTNRYRILDATTRKVLRWVLAVLTLIAIVVLAAFFTQRSTNPFFVIPEDFKDQVGFSHTVAYLDGLFSSLLLFNLTSDPNPLHGIVERPAFAPVMSAAFVIGILAWAWQLSRSKRWRDWLLPSALIIAALPSALYIILPLQYPHLGLAAMVLPVGLMFVAYGLRLIAEQFTALWGRRGLVIAAGLFLVVLYVSAQDARQHYLDVFLPTYERAAPIYNQLGLGR